MKNPIALALLGGTLAASPIMAANYDLYLTGSTAFRSNVHDACKALYDGGSYASYNNGTSGDSPSDALWTMTGTCVNLGLTSGSDTLTIHANWTGSVQGLSALLNKDQLTFLASASSGSTTLVTNTASSAFSDVYSISTLDPLSSSSFTEKEVAVQPFVFVKSLAAGGVQSITNVTWQQLNGILSAGSVPLSYFTGKGADTSLIYLVHRTLDSGTRVTTVQEAKFFGTPVINYFDPVSGNYYLAATNRGPDAFGYGYVGGGDVKTVMSSTLAGNQAIAYLSMADAKAINTSVNWSQILAYNGNYPIANYIPGTAPVTNDFSPVIYGKYSFWAYECLDYPKAGQWGTYSDQNLSFTQLGNIMNKLTGTGTGSIDNTILLSQAAGTASAIRYGDMRIAHRQKVGGPINP